jgi:steroid delta-isomerase-like uncharacterized protein
MSIDHNKSVVRRLFDEAWNRGNLSVVDESVHADIVQHDPSSPARGVAAVRELIAGYRAAFPDVHFTVDRVVAEGDQVAVHWTASGTHKGALFGLPPTGKQVTVSGLAIDRFVDGKIKETWGHWDAMGMFTQLGVLPALPIPQH